MCSCDDFWDCYDDSSICCEEHYEAGYDDGWNECASGRNRSGGRGSVGGGSEGCYIATAVYGSYDCPEVWVLRRFRDYGLRRSACGRALVRAYYAASPGLVERFGHAEGLKRGIKRLLDAFVRGLRKRGFEDSAYYER